MAAHSKHNTVGKNSNAKIGEHNAKTDKRGLPFFLLWNTNQINMKQFYGVEIDQYQQSLKSIIIQSMKNSYISKDYKGTLKSRLKIILRRFPILFYQCGNSLSRYIAQFTYYLLVRSAVVCTVTTAPSKWEMSHIL